MSHFRTVEISEKDANSLIYITVKSENLKGRGDISVFIPAGFENTQNLPMVILLHGVYGSHWAWAQSGQVHITLQKLINEKTVNPMGIIMPSDGLWGDGSGYLEHSEKNFEQWIIDDVPAVCKENLSCFSENSPLFISGLSMGGYGALRLGAKYPQRFKAFTGLSSITKFEEISQFSIDAIDTSKTSPNELNIIDLMLKNKNLLPPFRFDCGKEDNLYISNCMLSKQLSDQQIPHIFEILDGTHTWEYWKKNIAKSLIFFSQTI